MCRHFKLSRANSSVPKNKTLHLLCLSFSGLFLLSSRHLDKFDNFLSCCLKFFIWVLIIVDEMFLFHTARQKIIIVVVLSWCNVLKLLTSKTWRTLFVYDWKINWFYGGIYCFVSIEDFLRLKEIFFSNLLIIIFTRLLCYCR